MSGGAKHPQAATPSKKTDRQRIAKLEADNIELRTHVVSCQAQALAVLAFSHAVSRSSGIDPDDLVKHVEAIVAGMADFQKPLLAPFVAEIIETVKRRAPAKGPG